MPGVVLSVRLSPALAGRLEELASRLQCAPGSVVESLILAAKARDIEVRQAVPEAPFTARRTFRVSTDAAEVLRSAGAPSWYGRQVITYFIANPYALRQVLGPETAPVALAATSAPLILLGIAAVAAALLFALWYFLFRPTRDDRRASPS